MQLIKLDNQHRYLVGEQIEGRQLPKGSILEYKGEIITFEGYDNVDSIWKDAVEKGRYVFASTDEKLKLPLIDNNQVKEVWNNRTYSLADMRKCFEEARERITHPDWDYIHDSFEDFMLSFNLESEWEFTPEMNMKASKHDDLPHTQMKVNEKGYITIKSITVKK